VVPCLGEAPPGGCPVLHLIEVRLLALRGGVQQVDGYYD